ncbi:MAG TPA: protease pro-enzyme activation domain-containing protein [Ktedonobacteraceae bacterium]|nr:protease pro-enzyme activation domain-containing protein [Ktedonobacteraceae bacterium]
MPRKFVHRLIIAGVALLLVGVSVLSVQLIAHATLPQRVALNGQTVPLVSHATVLGAANSQQQLNLSVGLQLRNKQELESLLSNLYDPRSSLYHHFLTPQQFDAEFGPTAGQQQQVMSYLRSEGFNVTHVSSNGLLIDASATVAQVESAFQVSINNYKVGAHTFYANASAPTIPGSLSSLILSIGGLDNSTHWKPLLQASPSQQKLALASGKARRAHATPGGYGPSDLLGAYDGNALHQANILGDNQTVAVFELDGYQSSDITQYLQNYNLGTPNISNVLVDGYDGSAGQGAIEVELDIEVVAAMAPHANQVVYEGPNTTQGVNDTYNQIVTDNRAQVMTSSWGECEAQSGASELQTLDGIFQQGAAEGISMFAAAGDSGAYDCGDGTLSVDSPASDPYITGVGGTTLQINNGAYGSETVWGNSSNGEGGGGGLSNTFKQPSWQVGPGVQNQYSNGYREVPDVSADADPATGYAVYCTVSAAGCSSSGWIEVGGTSAAAPLWAGSTAMINQYLEQQGKSKEGYANPALYGLENATEQYTPFHDITTGNNLYYPATAGYDEASGWGSPDIYNIARDLAGSTGPGPTPTPSPTGTPSPTPTPPPTETPTPGPSPTATSTPPPTPQPTETATPTPPSGSLIQDGDFEDGNASGIWQESSAAGYELVDTTNPHSGQYSADLCGYSDCDDAISQSFTVPGNASSLTLSYWWYGTTNSRSNSCRDTFTVSFQDGSGNVIGTAQKACNTDANQQWQQVNFDASSMLASYAGQSVTLVFEATTSGSQSTSEFFVDDVSIG